MDFREIEARALLMSDDDMGVQLRSLMEDERAVALIRQITLHRDSYIKSGWHQSRAEQHGVLAHAAGSAFAMDALLGRLHQIFDSPHQEAPSVADRET